MPGHPQRGGRHLGPAVRGPALPPLPDQANNHEWGEIFGKILATNRLDDRWYFEYTDIKVVWGRPVCPSHFGCDVIYSL